MGGWDFTMNWSRRLLLLRHAKSDWPQGASDQERPLGPRGRHDAPRMGEEIARRGLRPEVALVSTATRARETFALVKPFLPEVPERFEGSIYEAPAEAILRVIRGLDPAIRCAMVVGHNPGLEGLAILLIGAGPERLRDRLGEKFPTAALAVIDFEEGGWRDIAAGSGRLTLFLTPADIE
jgi:phosphohistidine phosphatase